MKINIEGTPKEMAEFLLEIKTQPEKNHDFGEIANNICKEFTERLLFDEKNKSL